MVGKMAQGVARNRHYDNALAEYINAFATAQRASNACDRLPGRGKNLHWIARFQFGYAALVVSMVMRDQDAFEPQTVGFQPGQHGRCIARVDDESAVALRQQPDVIVFECRNE